MTRSELMLAILAAAEGQAYTPVQIQKAAFLIDRNLPGVVTEGPGYGFAAYDYGPFDSSVYADVELLQTEGLAAVAPSSAGRWKTYAAAPEGVARGRAVLERMAADQRDYIQQVATWVRSMPFSSLVKSIYNAYPEMRANSIFRD